MQHPFWGDVSYPLPAQQRRSSPNALYLGMSESDLPPSIRREVYMILRNEEESHVEGEAQRSGDDRGVEADGGWPDGGGRGARAGGEQATVLH